MMDIIEKLKDDHEYYNGIGRNYLSNSNINQLLTHPKLFRQEQPDNKNFLYGRYFHQLILEPEKAKNFEIVEASSRNTKVYKEACNDGNIRLLQKEADECEMLVDILFENIELFSMIKNPNNIYEQPQIKELFGVEWKGKADIISDEYVIDLKSTSDISKFHINSYYYNYDSQAFIYQHLFGKPVIFIAIDKSPERFGICGVFKTSELALAKGEEKVKQAVEVYNQFFANDNVSVEEINNYYVKKNI
jgi:hypothetical protein